jgi:prepilin-type N-terminal cleavage/methylation domain-containing protein
MTTFGQNGKHPQKGKRGFSKHTGFTLIELMLVLAVVAIITSFALPSYRTLIEKRQATSGAEQLAGFVSTAQFEAVKRNENISVSFTRIDSDTWCVGKVSGTAACDCGELDPEANSACVIGSRLPADNPHLSVINQANFNTGDDLTGNDCEAPGVISVLEVLPFFDVQTTFLARWYESEPDNPVDATSRTWVHKGSELPLWVF